MQKGASTLRALGRGEMVSLGIAYLESQARALSLLSVDEPKFVPHAEISDRVARLSDDELVLLLMPISALGHSD
jgi:hypothetical protein